jgi:hypothetical protein
MFWKSFVDSLTSDIPHSAQIFLGLKIAQFGFLGALAGVLFLFFGFQQLGQLIAYFGAGIFCVGMIMQFVILLFKSE